MNAALKNVMVVEDEAFTRRAIVIDLENEGYNCIEADDRKSALEILKKNSAPDAIIIDIMLNGFKKAGLNLIADIKASDLWQKIPILILSAQSQSSIILEALRLGAIDYLIKPYDSEELTARVKRVLLFTPSKDVISENQSTNFQERSLYRWRILHIETIRLALLYWEVNGKTKVELADKSGIWSVYIDAKGTCRTKTLDRYMNEHTLPNNPNTEWVISTGYFILKNCPADDMIKPKLVACIEELESLNLIARPFNNKNIS